MKAILALLAMATLALGQDVDTVRFMAKMQTFKTAEGDVRAPAIKQFESSLTYTNEKTKDVGGGWVIVGNCGPKQEWVLVEVHGLSNAIVAVKPVTADWIRLPKDDEAVAVDVKTAVATATKTIVSARVSPVQLKTDVQKSLGITDWESAICSVGKAKEEVTTQSVSKE